MSNWIAEISDQIEIIKQAAETLRQFSDSMRFIGVAQKVAHQMSRMADRLDTAAENLHRIAHDKVTEDVRNADAISNSMLRLAIGVVEHEEQEGG